MVFIGFKCTKFYWKKQRGKQFKATFHFLATISMNYIILCWSWSVNIKGGRGDKYVWFCKRQNYLHRQHQEIFTGKDKIVVSLDQWWMSSIRVKTIVASIVRQGENYCWLVASRDKFLLSWAAVDHEKSIAHYSLGPYCPLVPATRDL